MLASIQVQLINPFRPDFLAQVDEKWLLLGIEAVGWLKASFWDDHRVDCTDRLRSFDRAPELFLAIAIILRCRVHVSVYSHSNSFNLKVAKCLNENTCLQVRREWHLRLEIQERENAFRKIFTVRESWHTHGAETQILNFSSHRVFTIFISRARKILILILKNRSFLLVWIFASQLVKRGAVSSGHQVTKLLQIYCGSVEMKCELIWKFSDFVNFNFRKF